MLCHYAILVSANIVARCKNFSFVKTLWPWSARNSTIWKIIYVYCVQRLHFLEWLGSSHSINVGLLWSVKVYSVNVRERGRVPTVFSNLQCIYSWQENGTSGLQITYSCKMNWSLWNAVCFIIVYNSTGTIGTLFCQHCMVEFL